MCSRRKRLLQIGFNAVSASIARCDMKAAAAAAFALMRFIRSCVSALFGDFRLSAYDPVMQVIPPGELYFDIVAVGVLALVSRILILGFMALVAKGYAPYDSSSTTIHFPPQLQDQSLDSPPYFAAAAGVPWTAYNNWDSVHFTDIARHGYRFEHSFAFYPLLPVVTGYLARNLVGFLSMVGAFTGWGLHDGSSDAAIVVGMGLFVSVCSFVAMAVLLYLLTLTLFVSKRFARVTCFMLFISPASVFLSVPYSEAIYGALLMMACFASSQGWFLVSATACMLCSLARSNGILSVMFLLPNLVAWLAHLKSSLKDMQRQYGKTRSLGMFGYCVLYASICSAIAVSGFVSFQVYGYRQFCSLPEQPTWCKSLSVAPLYSHVQSHYWNVGFMRYWTVLQLPNFILAAPCLLLCYTSCWRVCRGSMHYVADAFRRREILRCTSSMLSPGVWINFRSSGIMSSASADSALHMRNMNSVCWSLSVHFAWPISTLPYVLHLLLLTLVGTFLAHVQVVTRLVCGCPAFYWAAAAFVMRFQSDGITFPNHDRAKIYHRMQARAVFVYFAIYTVLGCVLFSTFYPWT